MVRLDISAVCQDHISAIVLALSDIGYLGF